MCSKQLWGKGMEMQDVIPRWSYLEPEDAGAGADANAEAPKKRPCSMFCVMQVCNPIQLINQSIMHIPPHESHDPNTP